MTGFGRAPLGGWLASGKGRAAGRREQAILYLAPGVFDKGGVSRYCRYQVRALRETVGDDNVAVLSLLPPDEAGFEAPFRVEMASLGANWSGRLLLGAAAVFEMLALRPSVVWCAHAYMAPLAVALARVASATLVLNVYGLEVWTNMTFARRKSVHAADWVVADCFATLEHVVSTGLHRPTGTVVHWDCVDIQRFSPGSPGDVLQRYGVPKAADTVTVCTLARLSAQETYKGVDRLIDAMSAIPENQSVRLVISGDGTGRSALENRAKGSGRADRIFFTGRVSERDLANVYRACDVFSLITNRGPAAGEGIPLTPLEAAACGKPVLVGDQDGSREAAIHGESGFVLNPFDIQAIARSISTLASDGGLRRQMGMAGRQRVVKEHSYEVFRRRIRVLMEELAFPRTDMTENRGTGR